MYVPDALEWATALVLGLWFSIEAIDYPTNAMPGPELSIGVITTYVRAVTFPFFAGGCWFIMAAFSNAANNCVNGFNVCFTSPSFATTTATATASAGGQILYLLFYGLFFVFVVYGIAITFYLAFRPLFKGSAPI